MFRWAVLKTVLILVVVFAAGVTLGVVGTARTIQKTFRERMDSRSWQPRTEDWLQKELGLGKEQIGQARPEIEQYVKELVELRDDVDHQRKQVIGRFLVKLSTQLTPEQNEKLAAMVRERQQQSSLPASLLP